LLPLTLPLLALGTLWATKASATDGKDVFLAQKCDNCHTVSSVEITAKTDNEKMRGPDLSQVKAREAALLVAYLEGEEEHDGKAHRVRFRGSDKELEILVDWLRETACADPEG
jgi:cytochrome c2